MLDFSEFAGVVGGHKMQGRGALRFEDIPRIEGSVEADSLDASTVIASAIGLPVRRGASGTGWSTEPLVWSPTGLNGRVEFKVQSATLAPWLVARDLRGTARMSGSEVVFENVAGEVGKGRLESRLSVSNDAAGLMARLRVGLAGAELGAFIAGTDRPATAGRLTLQAELEGNGRSPAAFIGSLTGFGNLTLEQAQLVGLNPNVFGAVTRAVELGIPTEGKRIREFVTGALDNAGLPVTKASAAISINAGQARLRDIVIRADGADLQAIVNVDLADAMLDALFTLNPPPQAPGAAQPAVLVALKGALPAPKRTVDADLLTTWLTLRAVEQQAKQIEAMERVAREAAAAAAASIPKPAEPPAAPSAVPDAAPVTPAPDASAISGNAQAPVLPPPVVIPAVPKPRAAPRADNAAPARATAPPTMPSFGTQH
jgi:large subunit ribosomal protein L24